MAKDKDKPRISLDFDFGKGWGLTAAEMHAMAEKINAMTAKNFWGSVSIKRPEQDNDAAASLLLAKAVEVWGHPLGWRFECHHNFGQMTYPFTASYVDEEEGGGTILVSCTIVFTGEEIWDARNDDLIIERKMEDLWRKCEAELAAFE